MFAFRLALQLGYPDPDEMLEQMPSQTLAEWRAYAQIEPFGEERADLRAAIVAATVANCHRDPKKRKEPFEPKDFMPKFKRRQRDDSTDIQQLMAFAEMMNAAFGGVDVRHHGDNR